MLNHQQQAENEGNMAQSPAILIFFGEVVNSHMQHVKNTLDANFKNGSFLQYLCFYFKDGICHVKNILTGELYDNVEAGIQKASLELLSTDRRIFRSRKEIYFECLLSSHEIQAEQYYEEFLKLRESHNYNMIKTLYLMIDQECRENEKEAQKLIDRMCADEEKFKHCSNIYLLSNMLYDGSILKEDRIWQNYRLVADLILLGNTADSFNSITDGKICSYSGIVHDGMMTAAYSFLGKPLDDIAKISLYHLMKKLYEREETSSHELETDEFMEKFRTRLNEEGNPVKEIFKSKIEKYLPASENYYWLPWREPKSFLRYKRKMFADWTQVNEMTCSVLDAYYQMHYEEVLAENIQNNDFKEECEKKIHKFLVERFSFFELLKNLRDEQQRRMMHDVIVAESSDRSNTWEEILHFEAKLRVERKFCRWAGDLLEDELKKLYNHVNATRVSYLNILEEVRKEKTSFGGENEQMDHFYENEVEQFLSSDEFFSLDPNHTLFRIDSTVDDILEKICHIFELLITKRSIYGEPFEKEEEQRLNNVSELERTRIMKNRLNTDVSNQGRLHLDYDYKEERVGTFCLVNSKSVYIDELIDDEKMGRFVLFDLNRRDCQEMVELYKMEKLNRIRLRD